MDHAHHFQPIRERDAEVSEVSIGHVWGRTHTRFVKSIRDQHTLPSGRYEVVSRRWPRVRSMDIEAGSCEADFYIGVHDLQQEREVDGDLLFESAVEGCPPNFIDREAALLEPDRLRKAGASSPAR